MAKPEKRWQLLLVADDGRIIPFKRIKGMVMTLTALLVLLVLICAGLAWQLTAEKVRHRRTADQLADATRQMGHYKSQHELTAAELVLAEARMEKAGLSITRRRERIPQQVPLKRIDAGTAPDVKEEAGEEEAGEEEAGEEKAGLSTAVGPTVDERAPDKTEATPVADAVQMPAQESKPAKVPAEPEKPVVDVSDLKMKHDAGNQLLWARFRVKNTGPRSSPVAGRCVVVLKNDKADSTAWLAMPGVTLVEGKPDGKRGQAFKISRFRDMEIKATGQTDPSSFKTATVYVFDTFGLLVLAKDFSIDLPAPKPEPESAAAPASKPQPEAVPPATDTPAVPVQAPEANSQVNQQAPGEASGTTPASMPMPTPPDADAGAAIQPVPDNTPVDDPSLTDGVEPVKKEDARSRF